MDGRTHQDGEALAAWAISTLGTGALPVPSPAPEAGDERRPQVGGDGGSASTGGDATAAPDRVDVTPAAAEMLRRLRDQHGELMFHQSGGCCDGSSPMCYPLGDFLTGDADVHLGDLHISPAQGEAGAVDDASFTVPVWMSRNQFAYWQHTHLTIDVVPGRGAGFSLEAPEGVRFLIRSRLFTDAEWAALTPVA